MDAEVERRRRQRTRSIAIGLGLGALVILFYAATIVRLGPNALRKDGMSDPHPAASVAGTAQQPDCKTKGTCP
ncbi:MAG: hypothetical protein ACK5JT_09515 [Hyphomicrobiaceae bacterium]